jgi:hypothetical protein
MRFVCSRKSQSIEKSDKQMNRKMRLPGRSTWLPWKLCFDICSPSETFASRNTKNCHCTGNSESIAKPFRWATPETRDNSLLFHHLHSIKLSSARLTCDIDDLPFRSLMIYGSICASYVRLISFLLSPCLRLAKSQHNIKA